jgi:phosphoribosylaminoimidazolecarboxamide formyltransferase/IMP cyclohydrolase
MKPMNEKDLKPITRALISVSDKTGLDEFGAFLAERKVEILSTGGSAKALRGAGVAVTEVADHTGFPEIMDGRVKTLHPTIHGGILARRDEPGHVEAMKAHGIKPIDLVVINLYPFEATLAGGGSFEACVENIDIGGPALIRAAAKNHDDVAVVVNPADYARVMAEMEANGGATALALRRQLAALAYARTAAYDARIASWLSQTQGELFPHRLTFAGTRQQVLRYGENPHQQAAFYSGSETRFGVATAVQLQGKELSFNNLNDTDAAYELVAEFDEPACAIIKHANPCGVAVAGSLREAYRPRSPRCSWRWSSPPRWRRRPSRPWPGRRTCACSRPAAFPIRARSASPSARSPAGSWSRPATPGASLQATSRRLRNGPRANRSSRTCCSPSPSPST